MGPDGLPPEPPNAGVKSNEDRAFRFLAELEAQAALEDCASLRTLKLSGCRGLRQLELSSSSLRSLHACWCTHLVSMTIKCQALTSLYAYGCAKLTHTSLNSQRLATLELQKCGSIDDALLAGLACGAGSSAAKLASPLKVSLLISFIAFPARINVARRSSS